MSTITSANSVYTLAIPDVFPAPVQLQGYATDDAFDTDASDVAESRIGVDGIMSAGFTPFLVKQTLHFQADSPSIALMDAWLLAMQVAKEVFFANATISLPSVHKNYILTKGTLTNLQQIASAKKVLEPQAYTITWNLIVSSLI